MKTGYDEITEELEGIYKIAQKLSDLSSAFGKTGNEKLRNNLFEMSIDLCDKNENINTIIEKNIGKTFEAVSNVSSAMITLALQQHDPPAQNALNNIKEQQKIICQSIRKNLNHGFYL